MNLCITMALAVCAAGPEANPQAGEHPVAEALREATARLQHMDAEIRDYTCLLIKRERIKGRLRDHEYLFMKLRHRQVREGRTLVPFSVYLKYLAPADLQGREILFVEGRYDGKVIARRGGQRFAYVTTTVDPESELAREQSRYPITHVGMKNLLRDLIEVGKEELEHTPDEIEVKRIPGAKVSGRECTVIQFTHPKKGDDYRFHIARVFVDDELRLPIRFASYDWPKEEGGHPRLLEEYTYLDVKLNVGLSDRDFDYRNEEYRFRKDFQP